MRVKILFLFVFSFTVVQSQITITGTILDEKTKEPLEGVSVFYDGTTIGTITNTEGNFSIASPKRITASLVISYIGFRNKVYSNLTTGGSLGNIFLKEDAVELDEVILKPDTWSREKKLAIFIREFLGGTPIAAESKILNEEDIRLYYSKSDNVLYAYAKKPIQIENKFLGYNLTYNLVDFEVRYHKNIHRFNTVESIYYAGTTLFKEINDKKVKRKHKKNREKTYYGSTVHFMRALSAKRLHRENFRIFKGKYEVDPYMYLKVYKVESSVVVEQTAEKLNILYDRWLNSYIVVKDNTFYIDDYGNHSPVDNIMFGGAMGLQRVASILPLDYEPQKKAEK